MEIRKDGVYLTTHLSCDEEALYTWRSEGLSEAYKRGGQKGLDRDMVNILFEYAQLGKPHKSMAKYHSVLKSPKALEIQKKYFDLIDACYKSCDKQSVVEQYEREMREKLYDDIAKICNDYDKKHKNRNLER